jgi:ABC-2 type transport system permease protein
VLTALLRFEWRYHTRQASFAAASLFLLVLGFALTASRFGAASVAVNSSYLVMESMGLLSLLSLFAVAIFASQAVLRDVEHGMLEIVFATPVGRFPYLFGRLAGAALATLTVTALSALGMLAATFMPWIEPERLRSFTLLPYLWALLVVMLPNVLFATALLFAIAALTRSAVATYAGAVCTYILYLAVAALTNSPLMAASKPGAGGGGLVAMLDPFALSSFFEVTRTWSIAEKNTALVPLAGSLLANRLLWLAVTAAIFALVYSTFSFRLLRRSGRRDRAAKRMAAFEAAPGAAAAAARQTPRIHPRWLASYRSATRLECRALLWNLPFLLLLLLWMALAGSELATDLLQGEFGSVLYPATGLILATLRQPLTLLGTVLLVYFSGEVFWREQRHRMASIVNTTPTPGSAVIAAKGSALAAMIASLIAAGIVVGVLLQLMRGTTAFEPLVYLSLFVFAGLPLLLLAAAALLIHALSPGKYVGMVLVLLFVVYTRIAAMLGLEHELWRFGSAPSVTYTGMDGFGPNAGAFGWLMLHWGLIATLFLLLASMLWRGIGDPVRQRLRLLRRSTPWQRFAGAVLVALSLVCGGWILDNTNFVNRYVTREALNDWRASYERRYHPLTAMPQPSVTDIDLKLDFYPDRREYHVAATERIANRTAAPIRTIWVAARRDAETVQLSIDGARLVEQDRRNGMFRFDLASPLAPGARTTFRCDLRFARRGFEEGDQDEAVLTNGTFLIGFRIFPTFGYRKGYELTDPRQRAKHRLLPRTVEDDEADFEASQEPRVNLTATLSTSADQIAIGPGTLERSWQRGARRTFRYRTDAPIANDAAFGTARYAVARRRAGKVDLELYYDPAHGANVQRMLDAAAASLESFETSFGPYPHRQLRMAEVVRQPFAGYASPGMLWFTEDRAFLTDARDSSRPDIVTRRVVHEVAHQWWGHQLVPQPGPGASLLVETLAKHSESMMIERLRGREQRDQFLEMELDRYLTGRSRAEEAETPLLRVGAQPYVYYAKGAVVMNGIAGELGEPALNAALRGLLRDPHPRPADLLTHLRTVAPASAYPRIEEWLTEIVFYDLRLDSATARPRPDGRYDVTLRMTAHKSHADGRGNEHAVPLHEAIDVALIRADGTSLLARRIPLQQGTQALTLTVDELPTAATIDPHVTRVDKSRGDNTRRVE